MGEGLFGMGRSRLRILQLVSIPNRDAATQRPRSIWQTFHRVIAQWRCIVVLHTLPRIENAQVSSSSFGATVSPAFCMMVGAEP